MNLSEDLSVDKELFSEVKTEENIKNDLYLCIYLIILYYISITKYKSFFNKNEYLF